ncbi:SH2 domain-containing protein 2A [Malaclemys terrapin pileata]|uniref:SH2 domain-containing protein 2A n=1 Tax=Malaclemys terrapin pileata TaxID=2991368 RepID=UPI0023A81DA4|nr:SH2 domain-containing protein 2A [Malaclemys terrapin pileata]
MQREREEDLSVPLPPADIAARVSELGPPQGMDSPLKEGPRTGADVWDNQGPLLFSTFKPNGLSKDDNADELPQLDGASAGLSRAPAGAQKEKQPPGSQREQGTYTTAPLSSWPAASAKLSWSLLGDPAQGVETRARLGPGLDPPEAPSALQARTRAWFERTQASRIRQQGKLPPWFHGFISRRDTEQLLQEKPLGSFLIRFSESTVGFVLSYRGRDRCRHFILDQLEDECYVILGEDSAHAELQGLLQHYTTAPVTPYYEFLTAPCPRSDKSRESGGIPAGAEAGSGAPPEPANVPPAAGGQAYSLVLRQPQAPSQQTHPCPLAAEQRNEGCPSKEAPCSVPPLPAKAGPAQRPSSPMQEAGASADPYAHVSKVSVPAEQPTPAQPTEAKYQQLMRFHTYAEPREGFPSPERRIYYEPDEPIPFYAMGRGSLPSPDPENVYAEVELAGRPRPLPRVLQDTASTLPRGSSRPPVEPSPGHRRLLRSMSGQGSRRRRLPAALTAEGDRGRPSGPSSETPLEFDDLVYSRKPASLTRPAATRGKEGRENIYELISGDHPSLHASGSSNS